VRQSLPVYPDKQTFSVSIGMSRRRPSQWEEVRKRESDVATR